jgi:hypothetical protein
MSRFTGQKGRNGERGRDGMDIVTAFVSQALHVLDYLQDLGYVGG